MSKTNSAMKANESRTINGARIFKAVTKSARAESGFGFGRGIARSQCTAYIVSRDGVELGIVSTYSAAVALAS